MVNTKEISYIIINLGPGMKFQVYLKLEPYFLKTVLNMSVIKVMYLFL